MQTLVELFSTENWLVTIFSPRPARIGDVVKDWKPKPSVVEYGGRLSMEPFVFYREYVKSWVEERRMKVALSSQNVILYTFGFPKLSLPIPQICYFQGVLNTNARTYYWPARVYLSQIRQSHYIAVSEYAARMLSSILGIRPKVIYPPVKIEEFLEIAEAKRSGKEIISIGRFHPDKEQARQLEIVSHLRELGIDARLTIVGFTSEGSRDVIDHLESQIDKLALRDIVTL